MKKAIIYLTFVAAMLTLGSCGDKPSVGPETAGSQRDIYYTVSGESGFAGFSGSTVHVDTEAEWDALLDQFCDYAKDGDKVTFCSLSSQPTSKGAGSNVPTQITTSDRNELKAWMKEMEKAGKTVNVTYDDGTGTWNGRAYANLGNHGGDAEEQDYDGTLAFVPVPELDTPPLEGMAMALQTADGNTYIISIHGMLLWFNAETDDLIMRLLDGAPATLRGVHSSHIDLGGNNFLALDLTVPDDGVIEF